MKSIISRDNPTYKQLKKLAESARERRKTGRTLLDGAHLVAAYLETGGLPEFVFVSDSARETSELCELLEKIPTTRQIFLTPALFAELSPVDTPSGILAVVAIPSQKISSHPSCCLLLEDIQDPGNLGAILRSAAAAGVQVVYLSMGCVDAWSPKVLRGGMGAHFVLAIEERVNLVEKSVEFDGMTVATSPVAAQSLYGLDLTRPVAFMVGNEGAGLSAELLAAASRRVVIPMPGRMESLNAGVATAVCLFERVRQLSQK